MKSFVTTTEPFTNDVSNSTTVAFLPRSGNFFLVEAIVSIRSLIYSSVLLFGIVIDSRRGRGRPH